MVQCLAFILISTLLLSVAFLRYRQVYRNIHLGKKLPLPGAKWRRWQRMLIFALGQRKMFERPIAGIFHLFIYLAFIITQIELVEVILDGLTGKHRLFAPYMGTAYNWLINFIEILSVLALIATIVFLIRRNVLKTARFQNPEMKGWPSKDANIILLGEMVLIIGIFAMNGADQCLQIYDPLYYPDTGTLLLSSVTVLPLVKSLPAETLMWLERGGWWLHYLVVLGFIVYLPYSKHLHIFFAFPNAYFASLEPRGKMSNIPVIENEVRSMLGMEAKEGVAPQESFGAKDIGDLSWVTLLQAYSCTECGRCTAVCPANVTGKKLSPRKIMMDIRDRMEECGRNIAAKRHFQDGTYHDGKSLFDYITAEELYACTSCNACVEACPVLINPLEPIVEMRRYDILMNASGPEEWLPMFNSLENSQSVWSISESRTVWTEN